MGIYKRKQENKKTRKHAFDQESGQEKKKKKEENTLSTKKAIKKKETRSKDLKCCRKYQRAMALLSVQISCLLIKNQLS